ncbi:MAG: MFS transporter [Intrasporangium sp.]|uniref:MFS transporter n=1 Tax=Intrasporangium sp. TaxID=1925024 RepID=UPI002647CEE4|nr:MFS transporter [Intrasporangium sp.]MDN5797787.1 MFS transporter [Intrasporangium sp.]
MTDPLVTAAPGPRRALLAVASVAVALAAADIYIVVLALTDMMAGVGIGIEALQEATPIISGFLLGYVAALPLIGHLSDLLDRQRILLACLAIFVVGSAVTALAVDLPVLVGGRVLQGLGGGGLVPATLALVADLWPVGRRGTPFGVVGAVQELGSVLGPLLGAAILAWSGWRAIFWANVAAGIILYAAVLSCGGRRTPGDRRPSSVGAATSAVLGLGLGGLALAAPERLVTDVTLGVPFIPLVGQSRVLTPIGLVALGLLAVAAGVTARRWWPVLRRADLLGAVLVAVALGALVLTFASSDPEREVVGPIGVVLLPVGVLAVVVLAWWHRRAPAPLIPRGVVHGLGLRAQVVSLLVGAALVAVVVDVPLLARLTLTRDETGAALVLVRFLLAVPVGALLGGLATRRFGDGPVAATGLTLAGAGMVAMSRWGPHSLDEAVGASVVLVVVGLGMGLAIAPVNDAALADAPASAHGVASALVVVARMVGMIVGLALLTSLGLHRYYAAVRRLPDPFDTDALIGAGVVQVQTVLFGGAVAALVAAALCLTLGTTRPPPRERSVRTQAPPVGPPRARWRGR